MAIVNSTVRESWIKNPKREWNRAWNR